MRLFAAVPLPAPAQAAVAELLSRLRGTGWPVRWVAPELVHLTLKFFGEVTPDRVDAIAESLRQATAGVGSVPIELTDLGVFPSPAHPRVLWVGVDAPPVLELLQDRIERGADALGFPPEGIPFRPHVTLGRLREGHRLPPHALESFAGTIPSTPCLLTELVLYESVPGPGSPRYTPLATLAF